VCKEHYYDKLIGLVLNIVMGLKFLPIVVISKDSWRSLKICLKEFKSILEATKHRIDLSLVKLSYRDG